MKKVKTLKPKVIGWLDKADFPDLNLRNIDLKVDTGAFTSTIHCHHIVEVNNNGRVYIKFKLLDPAHPKYNEKYHRISSFKMKTVKSSNGLSEKRYVFITTIKLFNKIYPIELSLSERSSMKYPILLGRKFLAKNRFIINPKRRNISYGMKTNYKNK